MLHIALCDDEAEQRLLAHDMINEYISERGLAARVQEFSDAETLLQAVKKDGAFDLYLLDIVMPEMNGIQLGITLRESDPDGAIIYLSTSSDFALESYQARAFYYLLKPVEQQKLFLIFDEAVSLRNKRLENGLQVKTHGGTLRLLFDDILYAELKDRIVRYYLKDGSSVDTLTITSSFRDAVSPLLEDKRFLLCGASFAVNLYYVKMVDKTSVMLSDGRSLSLPKTACTPLRSAWSDYWLEGGRKK